MSELIPVEKQLLLKIAHGDEHAFAQLFGSYHQLLAAHLFRLTDSLELAEEVVQDAFLKIWLNRQALAHIDNFKAYLFVVSKNHALNCLRKLARERSYQKVMEESSVLLQSVSDADTDDLYKLLDEAIDHLPPQQQKVYLLSRHKRLKYDEIANQLGLSRETVKKYLQSSTLSITNFVQSNNHLLLLVILTACFF